MATSSMPEFPQLLQLAHELADLSGKAVMPYFRRSIAVENKAGAGGFDPVTAADRKAEEVIRARIHALYPDHGIVGEEYGNVRNESRSAWIIDPIDGTRAFVMGLPTWGTLIGLAYDGRPELGLMNQPFTGERFWSDAATAHYRGPDGARTLATRSCPKLDDAVLASTHPDLFEPPEWERFLEVKARVRMTRYGGDCLSYSLLAMGQIDLVIEAGLKTYDIAALIPIIERAGGRVTTWDGDPPIDGGRIVATGDPRLHDQVLSLLAI